MRLNWSWHMASGVFEISKPLFTILWIWLIHTTSNAAIWCSRSWIIINWPLIKWMASKITTPLFCNLLKNSRRETSLNESKPLWTSDKNPVLSLYKTASIKFKHTKNKSICMRFLSGDLPPSSDRQVSSAAPTNQLTWKTVRFKKYSNWTRTPPRASS